MRNLNQGGSIAEILEEVKEIERHFHNRERWFGISGDQSGNNWGIRGSVDNPYVLTSGANDWGSWVKILGTADTPAISGMVKFDGHRILVSDVDVLTPFLIQVAQGDDADVAVTNGLFTEFMYVSQADTPSKGGGAPLDIITRRVDVGTKIWGRCKCATADAISLFIGIHEYEE